MRRRVLGAMLLAVAVSLLGFGIPLALTVAGRDRDQALLELSAAAANAAVQVPGSYARDQDLPELADPANDIDLGLYDASGTRILGEGPAQGDQIVADVIATGTAGQNRDQLNVAIPVTDEEAVVGVIRTSFPHDVVTARTRRTWVAMSGLAAVVFVLAGLLAIQRSRGLAAPLRRLRDEAERLGRGDMPTDASASGIDEIDTVHSALREASDKVNDSLARERALSADLAHQLRTPLASLRIRLEHEQLKGGHDTRLTDSGLVDESLRDVDRLQATIDDLIRLARDVIPTGVPHPLATLVREATEPWEQQLDDHHRTMRLDLEPELPWVTTRPEAVRQILDIVIDNALVHGEGTVTVRASRRGSGAVVAVIDEGTSVVDAVGIFERHVGAGSGIGLALARRLAEGEGIRLVLAHAGPGAHFHLVFGPTA